MQIVIEHLPDKTEEIVDVTDIVHGTHKDDDRMILILADGGTRVLQPSSFFSVHIPYEKLEQPEHTDPQPAPPTPLEQLRADVDFIALMQGVTL